MKWSWTVNHQLVAPGSEAIGLNCEDRSRIEGNDLFVRLSRMSPAGYRIVAGTTKTPLLDLVYCSDQGLRGTLSGFGEIFGNRGRYWSRSQDLVAVAMGRTGTDLLRVTELERNLNFPPAVIAGFALEFMVGESVGLFCREEECRSS